MSKNILLLYPNQLFDVEYLPKDIDQIVLIEEPMLFGTDSDYQLYMHKQKLLLHRASMKRYLTEVLLPARYEVKYIEFHQIEKSSDVAELISHSEHIYYFDLVDDALQRRLDSIISSLSHKPQRTRLESPNFYLTREEIKNFFINKKKSGFSNFYLWQRERFNILMDSDTYKPIGGKLSFETDSRQRLPENHELPSFQVYGSNDFVSEARQYVEKYFPDNPGNIDDFSWPTNHQEANQWFSDFLSSRLKYFGAFDDALDGQDPWLYHSALSACLNIGLLNPIKVVQQAVEYHDKNPVPMSSIEGFVRQIAGWREYMRGIYINRHAELRSANKFAHQRRLTNDWYYGTTGIPPVDDIIKKLHIRGYAHNNERLMVLGNIMFLCGFHPTDVYRWFMEMFVDSYDWITATNVYGVSQWSDISDLVLKPYISSSNYILKMSHYEKDDWCDIWDGLYYRFLDKNRERFAKNSSMKLAIHQLDKMSEQRRRVIFYRAEDFLKAKTQNSVNSTSPAE